MATVNPPTAAQTKAFARELAAWAGVAEGASGAVPNVPLSVRVTVLASGAALLVVEHAAAPFKRAVTAFLERNKPAA